MTQQSEFAAGYSVIEGWLREWRGIDWPPGGIEDLSKRLGLKLKETAMAQRPSPEPHVYSMSVFDCPRIRIVRNAQNGCLSLYFGRITLNVYGHDPYHETPILVEQTERDASREALGLVVEEVEEPIL